MTLIACAPVEPVIELVQFSKKNLWVKGSPSKNLARRLKLSGYLKNMPNYHCAFLWDKIPTSTLALLMVKRNKYGDKFDVLMLISYPLLHLSKASLRSHVSSGHCGVHLCCLSGSCLLPGRSLWSSDWLYLQG